MHSFFFRYYVIVHPLKAQYLCTISKAKRTVFATWLAAFVLAIPILLVQVKIDHKVLVSFVKKKF